MANKSDSNWERFYAERSEVTKRVYPTEFVVRTFLAKYPNLRFAPPERGDSVLEMGFGDGRNTLFLCELGLSVCGVEVTKSIVDACAVRLSHFGCSADLRVGRNSRIPFPSESFKYILACHSCYYLDDGQCFSDNLREYSRVLEKGGWLIASVPSTRSYIFDGAVRQNDGSMLITNDPYGNRNGTRLQGFEDLSAVKAYLSDWFDDFSVAYADNDFFGVAERAYWVVCRRR